MNRKHLIALSMLALLGSNAAFAQESKPWLAEGQQGYLREYGSNPGATTSGVSHAQAGSERTVARAEGQAGYLSEYGIDTRPVRSGLTREEVLADLQLWRESGMAEVQRNHSEGISTHAVDYQRAAAKYAELRQSPRYGELVEQIARERGKPVVVSSR